MSEVYYRKWRPKTMEQVVGQESIMQTLRQAVSLDRVAHAYLFCGPRGTGKTSTARILAKAVNCLSPIDGEPDNVCSICVSINEGRALDLIEIDAASNRGIDDIRDLSEKINFTPNEARYKVYIIDEVHMLTEPAFNALLKTLEEPPGHAIFVLATTESHKVPLTIISRCQRFDFRRIPLEKMVDKLAEICQHEDVEAFTEALTLIARSSNGGLRDAENLLEQVVVSYGSPVTEDNVRDMLGLGGDEMALELVEQIINKSIKEGLTVINQVVGQGNDIRQLHRATLDFLRGVLLLKTGAGTPMGYSDDVMAKLNSLAKVSSMEHLVHALKTFSEIDLRRDSSSPLPMELALVESCTEIAVQPAPAPSVAPAAREQQPTTYADQSRSAARSQPPSPPRQRSTPPPSTAPAASHAPGNRQADPLEAVPAAPGSSVESQIRPIARALRHVGKKYKVGGLLNVCKEVEVSDDRITLKFAHVSNMERMQEELDDPQTRRAVQEVIAKVMGTDYDIKVSMVNGGNGASNQSVAQKSHLVNAALKMGARIVDEKEEEQP